MRSRPVLLVALVVIALAGVHLRTAGEGPQPHRFFNESLQKSHIS
jgi:hypothetical protein